MKPSLDILASDPTESESPVVESIDFPVLCEFAKTAWAYRVEDWDRIMFAIGCRTYACPRCGPIKKRQLIAKIAKASPTKFITLTCEHQHGPDAALTAIKNGFQKLVRWIRASQAFEYLRMLETCNDGYPHFHILARTKYIEQAALSTKWAEYSGARVVDIRKAHGRSTSYIAKYITKARNIENQWSRQRISVSKQFWVHKTDKNSEKDEYVEWEHSKVPPYESAEQISIESAFHREVLGRYRIVDREPGDETPFELLSPLEQAKIAGVASCDPSDHY